MPLIVLCDRNERSYACRNTLIGRWRPVEASKFKALAPSRKLVIPLPAEQSLVQLSFYFPSDYFWCGSYVCVCVFQLAFSCYSVRKHGRVETTNAYAISICRGK